MYFDAHIHLLPIDELIKAKQQGVHSFIMNATTPSEWDKIISLSHKIEHLYPAIGVHPWFIKNLETNWAIKMENLLKQHPFIMIGEIGLDYLKPDKEKQIQIFKTCLNLAQKYNRPVHIHAVKAWHDILGILKDYSNIKYLFHQFSASDDIIQKLSQFDSFFSISNPKKIKHLPFNRILVETDSPNHEKTPSNIVEIVKNLNLNPSQLFQNFQNFVSPFDNLKLLKEKKYDI